MTAKQRIIGGWHHVVGVLENDKTMKIYVDGELSGTGKATALISTDPLQPMEIGTDGASAVVDYTNPQFTGIIDEVRLYFLAANAEQIAKRFKDGSEISSNAALAVSFDDGTARDLGLNRNDGTVEGKTGRESRNGFSVFGKKKVEREYTGKPGRSQDRGCTDLCSFHVAFRWNCSLPVHGHH